MSSPLSVLQVYTRGKSLNNRNFTITFYSSTYRNCLCIIFRHSPPASQHTWSTCPQACGCPLEKSFLAWPLTNLALPPLPCHVQTSGPTNVPSKVQTSESPMAPSPDCMVDFFNTSNFRACYVSTVCTAVWWRALL